MVFCHQSPELAESLQHEIAEATNDSAARHLAKLFRRWPDPPDRRWKGLVLEEDDQADLRSAFAMKPLRERLLDGKPLQLTRPDRWSTRFGVRFAILHPPARPEPGSAIVLVPDTDLKPLQTMLNGTRQAVLHQHHRNLVRNRPLSGPGTRFEDPPDVVDYLPERVSGHYGPTNEYEDLLDEARSRQRAPLVSAIYLVDRGGRRLLRVAGDGVGPDHDELDINSQTSSVALATQGNRPPQVVNGVYSEPLLRTSRVPVWLGRGSPPADFSEVVVPIHGVAAADRTTVIGAFVAQCRSGNGRVFSSHDLAYFERLANRISLRRANLLFAEATEALAELTGHTTLVGTAASDPSRIDPVWQELPIDFANAHPFLRRTLQLLYRHAPCTGVALALLDVKQNDLMRVIEVGEKQLVPDRWSRWKATKGLGGLASYALRTGEMAVVPNVGAAGAFQAFGGAVTSEGWRQLRSGIAAPVVVADRPVGVMVVGAAQEHVLSDLTNFVAATAQQLCLSLILSQREEERRAFAFSSSTALHAHEILKRADQLREHPVSEVAQLGNEIEQLVDVLRTREGGARLPGDPIAALDEAIAETKLDYYVVWEHDPPELPPFPHATILAVKRAAVEILKNSQLRMVGGRIVMRARVDEKGPLPRLLIQMQHCIRTPLRPDLLPLLYRAPIEDAEGLSARRHYGAFTAGYWMRAVGGDVYLWRTETDGLGRHWIGTAIEVPILTLAPAANSARGHA
jgi:GAF domain-containing protein